MSRMIQFAVLSWVALHATACRDRSDTRAPSSADVEQASADVEHEIRGTVVSSGQPVAGATVRVKAHRPSCQTDEFGRFRLTVPNSLTDGRLTASKPGYLIAGIDLSSDPRPIELIALPDDDNDNYDWVDPTPNPNDDQRCGNCHPGIYDQWQSGAHATSATDPHFLDLYAGTRSDTGETAGWGLLTEYPEGAGICAACHTPAAQLEELGIGDIRDIEGVAQQGVHCDFCHKVNDVDLPAPGLTHGRFAMSLLRPEHDQLFFGPLDDVDRGEDSHLPMQSTSLFCAACHEGVVFGVPVYTTYSEWLQSPAAAAGKQCQNCHMKPNGEMTNIAEGFGGVERDPSTLASHELMPGGREAMIRGCVDVKLKHQTVDGRTVVDVTTTTRDVGHRVPTGFVDRHLLLVVEGIGEDGRAAALTSGARLPDFAGQFVDYAGRVFAKRVVDENGAGPVPFWRAGATVVDTRLHPDAARTDQFAFQGALSQVRVRILYRRFWPAVAAEKGWQDTTIVAFDRTWRTDTRP